MEIWKDIPGYESLYEASDKGNIRTKEGKTTSSARFEKRTWKQRILKQKYRKAKNGRLDAMVTLWKENKPHYYLVSRLVAATFCGNMLHTAMTVNHIDGNPLNNSASNLEWMSRIDNIKYGFLNGQYSSIAKAISVTNKNDGWIIYAESYSEMDRKLGQYHGYTSRMIKLKSTTLYDKSKQAYHINPF